MLRESMRFGKEICIAWRILMELFDCQTKSEEYSNSLMP